MSALLKQFEEFLAPFDKLKKVAGDPKRLAAFYGESSAIRDAAEKLENSALELVYNLEWFGPKRLGPVSVGFEEG